jgi:hypothetical protein
MFPHRNIHKYSDTFLDGKTRRQINQVLIDNKRNPDIVDVRSFRGADCDTITWWLRKLDRDYH